MTTPTPQDTRAPADAAGDEPPLLAPFAALRPAPKLASKIVAPPYDVLTTEEARAYAEGRPHCFFRVSRPEITLPPGTDPRSPEVYTAARRALREMIQGGALIRDPEPAYYVYRIAARDHVQIGLAAAAPIVAYEAGLIKRHEFTRPDREADRAHQIEAVDAQTGPIFAFHRTDPALQALLEDVAARPPDLDVAVGAARHSIWMVAGRAEVARIMAAVNALEALYIGDGHHRTAAAARVAASRKAANPAHRGDEPYNAFLVVTFPEDQIRVLDYNRVVRDLNGLSQDAFLAGVAERFSIEDSSASPRPRVAQEFGMYVAGRWYRLRLRDALPPADFPLARLDVSLLADRLLGPVLGVGDPREDSRIDFVGGARGVEGLEKLVDGGDWAVAFALYPTQVADLLAVADAGEVMPPKSTWFEPKLADGLISYPLD